MGTGEGPQQPLKVDTELLDRYGNQLLTAAGGLPAAPAPFVVTGSDPISAAIADKLPAMEGALQTELPQLKEDASQTASRIVSAADQYLRTDQQIAADYEKHQFDRMNGMTGGAGGSGAGAGSGAAGSMGQMGQLMGMPMQMASQAAQMPMQAMSALGSVPQSLMQGVQQVGQLAGASDGQAEKSEPQDRRDDERAEKDDAERGAAPGDPHAERAPEAVPATSPAPQHYSPRHAAPDPAVDL